MRILMLSWEYPPHVVGGLGAHVQALVPALARCGVEVTLVTPRWAGGEAETDLDASAHIYRVAPPAEVWGDHFAVTQRTNLNLEESAHRMWSPPGSGFDLIHAHDWQVAFAASVLKRLYKTPLVATVHATERGRGQGFLNGPLSHSINSTEWSLVYEAWRVITASQFMAEEVKNYFRAPADKIDVVPNGVDAGRFAALEGADLSEFRARWARPDERIVFFVGRMQYEKGPQLLVQAAPQILDKFPQARFVLAGTGPLVDVLKRRVSELGLEGKVQLAGFISNEERDCLFKVADLAVFPSLYEPFGIVALEAMAAKCPVLVSDVGGLKEVVRDQAHGFIVPRGDIASLASGILLALERRDWAGERAASAFRLVCEEYSWDGIAERTIEVYRRVIDERGRTEW